MQDKPESDCFQNGNGSTTEDSSLASESENCNHVVSIESGARAFYLVDSKENVIKKSFGVVPNFCIWCGTPITEEGRIILEKRRGYSHGA